MDPLHGRGKLIDSFDKQLAQPTVNYMKLLIVRQAALLPAASIVMAKTV